MSNAVTDILWWINSEVDKLSGHGLVEMSSILTAAEQELTEDLGAWLAAQKGDDRFTAQMYRNALVQIRGALEHIQVTGPQVAGVLKSAGAAAAHLAMAHLTAEVEKFSSMFEGTIRPIPFEAATVLARGKQLWPHFENSAARYAGQMGEDIRRQLAIGVVRGETIDQLTRRLSKHGGPTGLVALAGKVGDPGARTEFIAEGLFTRYRYWGERLARTETVSAYNVCALEGMREAAGNDPGYKKRWDAAIDGRTCELCGALDDLIVEVDTLFPGGFEHSPRHPNCRCAIVLWRPEWTEQDRKDDLLAETVRGARPGGVADVPHVIETPSKPRPVDFANEIAAAAARRPRRELGVPERAPASMTPAPEPPKPVKVKKAKPVLTDEQKAVKAQKKAAEQAAKAKVFKLMSYGTSLDADDIEFLKNFGVSEAFVKKSWAKIQKERAAKEAKLRKQAEKDLKALEIKRRKAQREAERAARKAAKTSGRYTPADFKTIPDGIFGRGFSSDGSDVENGSLQIRKTTDGHEITFKVTAQNEERLKNLPDPKFKPFHFYKRRLVNGVMETDTTDGQSVGDADKFTYSGYSVDVGKNGATRNYVRITVPGGDPAQVHAALEDFGQRLGVDMLRKPTRADIELQAQAQLVAKFEPTFYGERIGANATPEKIRALFEEVAEDHPIMREALADVEERELYPGHRGLYSRKLARYMAEHNHVLTHDGAPSSEIVESILTETGLMSSSTRYQSGIFTTGMSTSTDFDTGGADGVFTRVRKQTDGSRDSKYRFIIDPEQLGRLDWWAFDFDNYGRAGFDEYAKRWSANEIAEPTGFVNHGNEIIAAKGIPPSAILRVKCASSERSVIIDRMKARGLSEINGVPLEDFFIEDN